MNPLVILDDVRIASPCEVPWDEMDGDDLVRSCKHCNLDVYNIESLTAAEAVRLIERAEGRLCLRLYRRRDGTVLTADCPVGVRAAMHRLRRRTALGAVAALALVMTGLTFLTVGGEPSSRAPDSPLLTRLQATYRSWEDWALTSLGLRRPPPPVPPGYIMGDY